MGDLRSVINGLYLYAFGESSVDQRQFGFDGFDHFGGIGAASLQDHSEHCLFAINGHRTKARCFALFDFGYVANGYSKCPFAAHNSVAYVIETLVEACTPDKVLFPVELQILSSCRDVGTLKCLNNFIVGCIGCLKAFGVYKHIILLLKPTPADDLFNTVN